jgi:N-acetylglucosaminyldiphosphoundecaprenol N-acetyl-beta-D-mannosaminyltransferase
MTIKSIKFLGITFYNENYTQIKNRLFQKKSYLVIPAASALGKFFFSKNKNYIKSLQKSRVAIFDSGLFCLCLLFLKFVRVKKFSGYKFIKFFLSDTEMKSKKILILNSSKKEKKLNTILLNNFKFQFQKHYVCPIYNPKLIQDEILIKIINNYKPEVIIINIAGGIQELLALYLCQNIKIKFAIICSGAAMGFFSGSQAPISKFADRYFLGWFVRLIYNPIVFLPRLTKSLLLVLIVLFNSITIVRR